MSKKLAIVGLLGFMLLGSQSALNAQVAGPDRDVEIGARIQRKLADRKLHGVEVGVRNGAVMLRGSVDSAWEKAKAVDEALGADGVDTVASSLTITRAESDTALSRAVVEKLRNYTRYTVFDDINVRVEGGTVTLAGRVTMPYKSNEMATMASRVRGVQAVDNQVGTLPPSSFDQDLRYRLARAIYRDPVFSNHAFRFDPPIHIIVDRGHVTLTGAVSTPLERTKAEMIARTTPGSFSIENRIALDRR